MPSPEEHQPLSLTLSARRDAYRREVQRIVREGAEHPSCELVRELPLQTLEQKLDFVKQMQGIGNALLTSEKLLVIGADQKAKAFFPVTNLPDFDPARMSQVLAKYLHTLPLFESFTFEADTSEPFVVIVIAPKQPKPLIAKSDAQAPDGRFLLRRGDIWIKENTGLRPALRSDLDAMYEEDSEARARRWFDRLSNQLLSSYRVSGAQGTAIPQADLIYGDPQTFRLYVQTLIAGTQQRHFRMLLDLLHDLAIDGWNKIEGYSTQGIGSAIEFEEDIRQHEKDYFQPSIRALIELGLLLIKHSADSAWLVLVLDSLTDVYESSSRLTGLGTIDVIDPDTTQGFGPSLPALEASIGIRALALYALRRERLDALSFVMKRYVRSLVPPRRSLHPFLFWPVPTRIKMPNGPILFCWEYRIGGSWSEYFGSREEYLRLALQLEFILELNSWLGTSPEGKAWLDEYKPNAAFEYYPDIARADLNAVVSLAEKICEALEPGGNESILVNIMVERTLLDARLKLTAESRTLLLGAYLDHFTMSQSKTAHQMGRFPFMVNWGDKIRPLLQGYRDKKAQGTLPPGLSFLPLL